MISKNSSLESLAAAPTFPSATVKPGGVDGSKLWVQADLGASCITDNCDVSTWKNLISGNNLVEQGAPADTKYKLSEANNGKFNFNPYISGAATNNGFKDTLNMGNGPRNMCSVHEVNEITGGIYRTVGQFGVFDNPWMGYGAAGQTKWDDYAYAALDYVDNNIIAKTPTLSCYSWTPGGKMNMGLNGKYLTSPNITNTTPGSDIYIGYDNDNPGIFDGNVAEVVVTDKLAGTNEVNKIQSYLAAKYGITLDQSTPQNYIATDNSVFWDSGVNSIYKNNITVIGRDDATYLDQKQSKSVNQQGLVTVGLNSIASSNSMNSNAFSSDKSYFSFGDDNGALKFVTANAPSERMILERKYKVQSNLPLNQKVKLTVPDQLNSTSQAKIPNPNKNTLYLAVDEDANGTFEKEYPMIYDSVKKEWDPSELIPNGSVFTFTTLKPASPAGVLGSVLWTKSDDSSCVPNINCLSWKDNSTNSNPIETTGTMKLQPGDKEHNYQPWFSGFSASNYFYDPNGSIAKADLFTQGEVSIFGAAKPNSSSVQGRIVGIDNDATYAAEPYLSINNTGKSTYYSYWGNAVQKPSSNSVVPGETSLFDAITRQDNSVTTGLNGVNTNSTQAAIHGSWGNDVQIGYGTFDLIGAFPGDIQEVIWYNNPLNTIDTQKVRSYLAARYGTTLDQSIPQSYIASNDTSKMWDHTISSVYKNNITVIGRDDNGSIDQKQSIASTTSTERISLSRESLASENALNSNKFSKDLSFLSSADNNLTGKVPFDTAACPGPNSSNFRTNRIYQLQSHNYSEKTTVSADWLGSVFNPNGRMTMVVADDALFSTNRNNIPMVKNGLNWEAPYVIAADSIKYVAFVGEEIVANLMVDDKEINWLKTPWNGGDYLPGTLGWGPGTMTQTQGDTTFNMKWSDPANTSYAKSIWSGYPSYYPLTYGDTVHWVGLDTGTPDAVTFEIAATKAAKTSSFTIHGIDNYYYYDTVKVEGFLNGSPVNPKLSDYSGFADSVSSVGNVATGSDWWGNRWYPYGDVKVNFNSPIDKILA